MSIRRKIIISLCLIIAIITALLSLNSIMARQEGRYVKKLLWIHHQYTALLNLKIHVTRQLSEAQDIFIYGKKADADNFQETSNVVQSEGVRLSKALMEEDALAGENSKTVANTSDNQRRLLKLQHNYEDLQRQLILMASLLKVGRKVKAQEHFQKVISGQFNDFFTEIDDWIIAKRLELNNTEASFVKLNQRYNYSSIVALGSILAIVIIFAAVLIYMLSARIQELLKATNRIAHGDLLSTVVERGNDEFTQFAKAMNLMIASLASSRHKLLEQSYYSGMADMVAGTLHNIRNALSPVVVDLEIIDQKLIAIRTDRLRQAMVEIMAEETSAEKRRNLLEFMALSVEKSHLSVLQLLENLAGIGLELSVISKVLDNNTQYSVAERPLENVILASIIQDSLGLVNKKYLETVSIIISPEIAEIGSFMTQRIVLVQIIANLLNNAIESIIRTEVQDGVVNINAEDRQDKKGRELCLRIIDNGAGIADEMLEKIFQRGVSSKKNSTGLGLHWCANAVSSLKGSLKAANNGVTENGAILSLILELPLKK